MGDRGNIAIQQYGGKGFVYLYTHWEGSEIGTRLQYALRRKERWDDAPYLARIIFDEMTEGQHGQTTGFGIATYEPDNEHPTLYVDCMTQQVSAGANSWTFQEFIELDDPNGAVNG